MLKGGRLYEKLENCPLGSGKFQRRAAMTTMLAYVSARGQAKNGAAEAMTREYVERSARLATVTGAGFGSEEALLAEAGRAAGRVPTQLVLFDGRGENLSSEEFAMVLGKLRDGGAQRVMCCVGPANGWSMEALGKANRVVALGRMTLPHELARVVVAEQVYRALTILAGHPYHCGH